jgi:hypothetical protein
MSMLQQQELRRGSLLARGRFARVVPWIGTAIALMAVASAVRRKGVLGGTAHVALNAMPLVGSLKALAETIRGRDFIPDRA